MQSDKEDTQRSNMNSKLKKQGKISLSSTCVKYIPILLSVFVVFYTWFD